MKRLVVIGVILSVFLSNCGGPVPYSGTDQGHLVMKADTIFSESGDWIAGKDLYLSSPRPHFRTWPFWLAITGLLILSSGGVLLVRKVYRRRLLRREAEESEAVMNLVKDRVSMVRTLTTVHDKTVRQNRALSYPDELEFLQETVDSYHTYLEELRKDKSFMSVVEAALNAGKNDVMKKARRLLGESVSEEDFKVLSCFLAGMTPASISFVTGIKPGTIRVKKSRLKEKINATPDHPDKEALLKQLQKIA